MARFCPSTGERLRFSGVYHGETETGITTMLMDAGYGGNAAESFYTIHLLDNAQDLAQRLAELGADLLVKPFKNARKFNSKSQATYAPLIQSRIIRWTGQTRSRYTKSEAFFLTVRLPFEASC